ncbi:MAG: histidinol dehydrogenase [Bacteroidota bacterium]|nr:histidinol dehydrogenase [Bacteroidota bacterium]
MTTIAINPPKSKWPELLERPAFDTESLDGVVGRILSEVRLAGDEAVLAYSKQFSGFAPQSLWVTPEEIRESGSLLPGDLKQAISLAKKNIEKFHRAQVRPVHKVVTTEGVTCWRKNLPVERVGLYIPGGSAPLFSTLLMLAIPARIAGCEEIVVATPAQKDGSVHPAILYAAQLLGVDRIYKSGGAQAIGALAYGTPSLAKVQKIFGPGNQYVTCAKKLVNREGVAIDMLAGPSELAVFADESCIPEFVAADLLSQAEHGADSQVVLVATKRKIIDEVIKQIHIQLPALERKNIVEESFLHRRLIVLHQEKQAFEFLNAYAPEHLIIASAEAARLSGYVRNAGSVFLGNLSPESAGDYASGTNHSLPTGGTALTYSGVSVDSFVKKVTFQQLTRKGIKHIGPAVMAMAEAEGLGAHRNAVGIRLKKLKK